MLYGNAGGTSNSVGTAWSTIDLAWFKYIHSDIQSLTRQSQPDSTSHQRSRTKVFALVIKYDKRLFKDEKELKGENTTLGILYKCLRTSRRENTSIGQPANEMVVSE